MKTKSKKYDPSKVKLTSYEKTIEKAKDVTSGPVPHASAAVLTGLRKAAASTLVSVRGGKRTGAGRKPRAHVKTTILLAPNVRKKLEKLAKETGSLSSAAEKAIMAL
jgi:hypothetical protein